MSPTVALAFLSGSVFLVSFGRDLYASFFFEDAINFLSIYIPINILASITCDYCQNNSVDIIGKFKLFCLAFFLSTFSALFQSHVPGWIFALSYVSVATAQSIVIGQIVVARKTYFLMPLHQFVEAVMLLLLFGFSIVPDLVSVMYLRTLLLIVTLWCTRGVLQADSRVVRRGPESVFFAMNAFSVLCFSYVTLSVLSAVDPDTYLATRFVYYGFALLLVFGTPIADYIVLRFPQIRLVWLFRTLLLFMASFCIIYVMGDIPVSAFAYGVFCLVYTVLAISIRVSTRLKYHA